MILFKRKTKPTIGKRLLNLIWPDGGWKRYGRYILLRLNRLKGTPKEIASGVACGVAISFTPFIGFHLILGAVGAWFVRGNILASAFGTLIGNPWTFPFIWVSVLYTGRTILGMEAGMEDHVKFIPLFDKATRALMTFDFHLFITDVWPIVLPMIIGCIPFYFASWFISYYLIKGALDRIEKDHNMMEKRK